MVQHRDEATERAGRQFSESAENGMNIRSWQEDSQHEWYMVVSFPGTREQHYMHAEMYTIDCLGGLCRSVVKLHLISTHTKGPLTPLS